MADERMNQKRVTKIFAYDTLKIQLLKIVRKNKKEILVVNWQAHVSHAATAYPIAISSDFVYYVRKGTAELCVSECLPLIREAE